MRKKFIILSLFAMLTIHAGFGQSEDQPGYPILINAGFDPLAQGVYAGFEQEFDNYSIGLDVGSGMGMITPFEHITLTIDNNFYFGEFNQYQQKTWCFNARINGTTGFSTLTRGAPARISLIPGLGKELTLSENIAFNINLGLQIPIYTQQDSYENHYADRNDAPINITLIPNIRLELKFR